MKNGNSGTKAYEGFPAFDEYIDFAGKKRTFSLEVVELPHRYVCIARESGRGGEGYEFQASSRIDPVECLTKLRSKIPRPLSVRHLIEERGSLQPSHDLIRGRITSGGVFIDGKFLTFGQLEEMIQTYEGFQFELRFVDPSDDVFA